MSDNKLLAENTIRRFMKLANVAPLADNFISENQDEESLEEEINEEEEVELEEQQAEEEDPEEAPEEDPDMEMDMAMGGADAEPEPDAMGAADMSLTEEEARVLIDLGKRLEEAMAGAEDAPEDGLEDAAAEEPEMEEEDPAMAYSMEEGHDDLVQEVLKRVTKRLVAEKLKN